MCYFEEHWYASSNKWWADIRVSITSLICKYTDIFSEWIWQKEKIIQFKTQNGNYFMSQQQPCLHWFNLEQMNEFLCWECNNQVLPSHARSNSNTLLEWALWDLRVLFVRVCWPSQVMWLFVLTLLTLFFTERAWRGMKLSEGPLATAVLLFLVSSKYCKLCRINPKCNWHGCCWLIAFITGQLLRHCIC